MFVKKLIIFRIDDYNSTSYQKNVIQELGVGGIQSKVNFKFYLIYLVKFLL